MATALVQPAVERVSKRVHLPALDGLRGIAILLVLMVHSVPHIRGNSIVVAALNSFFHSGTFGVDLFFVLSGFLITGILLDSKGSPRYFRSFYIRRILRLFPVYYGFLIVLAIIVPAIHRLAGMNLPEYHGNWWWYLLYFSNWKLNHEADTSLGHFWSLALEEQFYFFWPLTVYLLPRRVLVWWCCLLGAIAVGLRCTLVGKGIDLYAITPSRLDALVIGALLAIAVRNIVWRERIDRYRKPLTLLTLAGFLFFVLQNWRFPWNPLSAFFAAAWFGMLVFQGATQNHGVLYRFLNRPLLRNYGKYSYCIYVVHLVFIDHAVWLSSFLRSQLSRPSGIFAESLVMISANVIIYWVARASWRYYEQPILRWKDRVAPITTPVSHQLQEPVNFLDPVAS
jgi:peptidoglycan/LPS O-acetylase OafA/YrhL